MSSCRRGWGEWKIKKRITRMRSKRECSWKHNYTKVIKHGWDVKLVMLHSHGMELQKKTRIKIEEKIVLSTNGGGESRRRAKKKDNMIYSEIFFVVYIQGSDS